MNRWHGIVARLDQPDCAGRVLPAGHRWRLATPTPLLHATAAGGQVRIVGTVCDLVQGATRLYAAGTITDRRTATEIRAGRLHPEVLIPNGDMVHPEPPWPTEWPEFDQFAAALFGRPRTYWIKGTVGAVALSTTTPAWHGLTMHIDHNTAGAAHLCAGGGG